MRMNVAIVDDNPYDRAKLQTLLRLAAKNCELGHVVCYSCGEDMLKAFVPGSIHLVFMDIIMMKQNGIETARKIRHLDADIMIVFLTTSKEYAFEAFPIHAFDYIIKPCDKEKVKAVLSEAAKYMDARDPKLTINIADSQITVAVSEIISAMSSGHKVEVRLTEGRVLESRMTFREIERIFSEHDCFLLCNRGILVNMSQVYSLTDGVFIMKDGTRCPVRVSGRTKIKAAFSQFLITNMRNGI